MAEFGIEDVFGAFASVQGETTNSSSLTIYLSNFLREASDMPDEKGVEHDSVLTATQILYALLVRMIKVQALTINGDPEQSFFIANAGKSLARVERDGQIKQSFTVSFFVRKGSPGIPAVSDIGDFYEAAPLPSEP